MIFFLSCARNVRLNVMSNAVNVGTDPITLT